MKIRIKFSKHGAMKFIGHLDVMRYFQKAMRRADVDIRYSEGFSPHQIMSFASPLGVGLVSNGEYMDIEVLSTGTSEEMVNRLNDVMVDGIKVLSWKKLPDNAVNAMSLVAACDYTVRLKEEYENGLGLSAAELFDRLSVFLQCDSLEITKKTKKGEKQMDIRPWIYEAQAPCRRGRLLSSGLFRQHSECEAGTGFGGILQLRRHGIPGLCFPDYEGRSLCGSRHRPANGQKASALRGFWHGD